MSFIFKKLLLFSLITSCYYSYGQVKIGDNPTTIDPTSLLELESTSKVLVLSRVTDTEMLNLTPLNGALVYNIDEDCVFYYNGIEWNNMCAITPGGEGGTGDETITTIVRNENGTYTYFNEDGQETLIFFDGVDEGGNQLLLGEPGSIFFAANDGTPAEKNNRLYWDDTKEQLGVGTNKTNARLSVSGSISTPITFLSGTIGPSENHHTLLINGDTEIFLPSPADSEGVMYVIKKLGVFEVTVPFSYYDSNHVQSFTIPADERIVWLQSSGFTWEQIN